MFVRKSEFDGILDAVMGEIDEQAARIDKMSIGYYRIGHYLHSVHSDEDDAFISALWQAVANLEAVVYAPTAKPKPVKAPVSTPDIKPNKRISAPNSVAGSNRTKKA